MFTKRQLNQVHAAVSLLGLKETDFELLVSAEEIRYTHKETRFYFFISPQSYTTASVLNTIPVYSELFVTYTPDIDKLVVNKNNYITHPIESWEEAIDYLNSWLRWIRQEFYEQIEHEQVELEQERGMAELIALTPGVPFIAVPKPTPLIHLHPDIQKSAGSLFASNHYPQAIHAACTALEKAIQQKGGQSASVTGTALIGKVFPKDNPLVQLSDDQGEREGYSFLYRGLLQAIRNHYAHNLTEIPAARALEWLGFISALFYKLD